MYAGKKLRVMQQYRKFLSYRYLINIRNWCNCSLQFGLAPLSKTCFVVSASLTFHGPSSPTTSVSRWTTLIQLLQSRSWWGSWSMKKSWTTTLPGRLPRRCLPTLSGLFSVTGFGGCWYEVATLSCPRPLKGGSLISLKSFCLGICRSSTGLTCMCSSCCQASL